MKRRSQHGAITPLLGALFLGLSVLVIAGVTIGMLAMVAGDVQRAADAAALTASKSLRGVGLPFEVAMQERAERLAAANLEQEASFEWDIVQHADEIHIEVTVAVHVDLPALMGGDREIRRTATAAIRQRRFDQAERRLPKLALVLDYSDSMNAPFFDGGQRKIDLLEASVRGLLDARLMVEYGAILFSGDVLSTIAIDSSSPAEIDSAMTNTRAHATTNTEAALDAARDLITGEENTGYYVLLVSDGEPTCGGLTFICRAERDAKRAAERLWDADVTLFTLEIRDRWPSQALAKFMTDVAGTPSERANPAYHFVAESAEDLARQFQNVVSHIVCTVGPLDIDAESLASLDVLLTAGGDERPIEPASSEDALIGAGERYYYSPQDKKVKLSEDACDAVIERGQQIVLRYGDEYLVE